MSEVIKAQYRILSDLRRIDGKVLRFQADIVRIPEEIAKLDQALASRKQELDKAKEAFETAEKKQRQAEQDLKVKEDSLNKAESKMMEVKTNEEYQAAIKENQSQKDNKGGLETQVISLMSDVDQKRQAFKAVDQDFKEYDTTLRADRKKLEEERAKLVNLLEEQIQLRQGIAKQLEQRLLTVYDRLSSRGRGAPIVIVEDGMCLGCNMRVRPQLYNEVIGYQQIHVCPSCAKILIPRQQDSESVPDAATGTH